MNKKRECTDFQMKVPWGHISGRWWGPRNVRPILLLHGWQDNLGTFSTLLPLLPEQFSYLAIDFPGHGFSSYLPEGMTYHYMDFATLILRMMKELKWDKVSILGHSMGGVVGFWFAAMFPDKIDLLIAIDTLKPPQFTPEQYWPQRGIFLMNSLRIEESRRNNEEPSSYTYEECVDRLCIGTGSVDRDKAKYLLERNLKESKQHSEKYYFLRDGKLKYMNKGIWPQNYYRVLASRINIPHLFINALDGEKDMPSEHFEEIISILRKNPLFRLYEARGRHHIHLNNPENISTEISEFVLKHAKKSCSKAKL